MPIMPKDTYKSLLKELHQLNKQVAQLNKKIVAEKSSIAKRTDKSKIDAVRKKIGLK